MDWLDVRVDRAVVTEEIISPDILEQLISRERDVFVLDQIEEQFVFFRSKLDPLAVYRYGAGWDIDLKAFEIHDVGARLLRRIFTRQYGIDSGHELFRAERFDDVVVDTELETEELVVFLAAC